MTTLNRDVLFCVFRFVARAYKKNAPKLLRFRLVCKSWNEVVVSKWKELRHPCEFWRALHADFFLAGVRRFITSILTQQWPYINWKNVEHSVTDQGELITYAAWLEKLVDSPSSGLIYSWMARKTSSSPEIPYEISEASFKTIVSIFQKAVLLMPRNIGYVLGHDKVKLIDVRWTGKHKVDPMTKEITFMTRCPRGKQYSWLELIFLVADKEIGDDCTFEEYWNIKTYVKEKHLREKQSYQLTLYKDTLSPHLTSKRKLEQITGDLEKVRVARSRFSNPVNRFEENLSCGLNPAVNLYPWQISIDSRSKEDQLEQSSIVYCMEEWEYLPELLSIPSSHINTPLQQAPKS